MCFFGALITQHNNFQLFNNLYEMCCLWFNPVSRSQKLSREVVKFCRYLLFVCKTYERTNHLLSN